ncbi:LuxR family transcriptional regulator [Microlunatus elymi]|uniref:LuxR family transcriptional regulator n=1 Tax=Microlunatus elymi TaxID=2596828 RepID=UPI001AEF5620|nr:LuxR family transcriptional regulator [Microlunatus elymi]
MVALTAPAGYGKTTMLAEWALVEERRTAWVSLDRFDDDPVVLLTLLASAYARVTPGNDTLAADMRGRGVSALGRAAPMLSLALKESTDPFVLFVDDLHELRAPHCRDVLSVIISGIPPGSQLVLASRTEQRQLARLRAGDDLLEFGAADLALDVNAAAQIFAEARVPVSAEQAIAVTGRTEGWPVGLYLAALIARDRQREALSVSGDDRYVADYLYRESLMQQPRRVQRFLRRTAVLDHLNASLCDALIRGPGSQQLLQELETSSVFLIPLDRQREWYRYHTLFREFLLGELRRVEPELMIRLQLRAADWYEEHGSPAKALEQLLGTGERRRCAELITALALPTYLAGELSTLQRWLQTIGNAAITEHPPLAVIAGWIAALSGQVGESQRWLAAIDDAEYDSIPGDGSASFASARAMLRSMMCANGPQRALRDARQAVAEEPPWSPWRDQALCLRGEAYLLTGDVGEAKASFTEATANGSGISDAYVLGSSELALLAMDRGDWTEASEHVRHALAVIEEHRTQDYPTSLLGFAGAARLAVHDNDRQAASRQLVRGMRTRPVCTVALPYLAVRGRLQLARVYLSLDNRPTARQLLREIDDILLQRPELGALVDEVAVVRRVLNANSTASSPLRPPLSPAELRLLPYLQTHLTIREIGDRLFLSRNTVSTEVGSIYRKLGVSSRSHAVELALALGLLGG